MCVNAFLFNSKVVYRYSLLSQTEEDIDSQLESALNVQKPVYDECSDDEVSTIYKSPFLKMKLT